MPPFAALTEELKKLAQNEMAWEPEDLPRALEEKERHTGHKNLRLVTDRGFWPFIVSLIQCTRGEFWRTLAFMAVSTAFTAAPPLLIEKIMVHFNAIQADPMV